MPVSSPSSRQLNTRRGALTVEWILLVSVVVIGTMGGLAAIRNAAVTQLQSVGTAVDQLNVPVSAGLTGGS